ncbi:MAG: phosphoribosylaminoimidazolesuccinocarboxamide synthase [Myxococcota bacterium]
MSVNEGLIRAQLSHTLYEVDFALEGYSLYRGKVRDVFRGSDRWVIVTTDRVSAFDVVLGTIPFKGEILNRMALHSFDATRDIAPNHVLATPDPSAVIVRPCRPFPVEFVMRGYITGSLWRDYEAGRHGAYEVPIPKRLRRDERLPEALLTPSTKAAIGTHDEPTSRREVLASGDMTEAQWDEAESLARALFQRGQEQAEDRGLILVDTKYEMGIDDEGRITLIDEVHTPDSSRYWIEEDYQALFEAGQAQRMLDKENLRAWLMQTHGFRGEGPPPVLDEEIRVRLASRYLELFQRMSTRAFRGEVGSVKDRLRSNLADSGLKLIV